MNKREKEQTESKPLQRTPKQNKIILLGEYAGCFSEATMYAEDCYGGIFALMPIPRPAMQILSAVLAMFLVERITTLTGFTMRGNDKVAVFGMIYLPITLILFLETLV